MSEWNELHPADQQVYTSLGVTPGDMTQVVGTATASAGYHLAEGYIDGRPYTSCADLAAHDRFLTRAWASRAYAAKRIAFFRDYQDHMSQHIHVVSVGLRDQWGRTRIQPGPRMQIIDFIRGLNGLVNHRAIRQPFTPTVAECAAVSAAYNVWAPGVRTKVYAEDGRWIPCYAFGENGTTRCEVRALVEGIEPGRFAVGFEEGHVVVRDTQSGDTLPLVNARPVLEGGFTRANVRGIVEALPGWGIKSFELFDDGEWAKIVVAHA